jgi:hypothetical protein
MIRTPAMSIQVCVAIVPIRASCFDEPTLGHARGIGGKQ